MHCAKDIKKDHLYCNYRFTLSSFSTSATGIRTSLVCLQSFPCQPILHTVRNLTRTQIFHILLLKSVHLSVKKKNCMINKVHHFLHLLQFYLSLQVSMHTHTQTLLFHLFLILSPKNLQLLCAHHCNIYLFKSGTKFVDVC